MLSFLDVKRVGLATISADSQAAQKWGLAATCPHLQGDPLADPRMSNLLRNAFAGATGSLHLEGYRYFVGPVPERPGHAMVLVLDAKEEAEAKRLAQVSGRMADALKSIGKVLTTHQTLQPLAVAAAHAIAASTEMAAVLLWARPSEDGAMELVASVGANRVGTTSVAKIDVEHGMSCAAEICAARREPLFVPDVHDNPMTAGLEARFCHLPPGGLMVLPLTIGHRLIGLLELVSREGDVNFAKSEDLFKTVAEHLALALSSALMFEHVERQASFDPLTGIANHRAMQEFLHRRILEAQRSRSTIGVIMLDVDHFRLFNETEGHDAGDKVLKMVANALNRCVRPYDLAARYGGEEFTVIMPGANAEVATAVAERVRQEIQRIDFISASGERRQVTASFGCAIYPDNAADSASILKAADSALYEAKARSRNATVLYGGTFVQKRSTDGPTVVDDAREAVPIAFREQCEAFLDRCRPYIGHAVSQLGLPASQSHTLQAAALLWPYWATPDGAAGLSRAGGGLVAVASVLKWIDERYDGRGKDGVQGASIPVLTRILSVIRALVSHDHKASGDDEGRYDPMILAVLSEADLAA